MGYYVKNPAFEFIDDEKTTTIFASNMEVIYSVDLIGKTILDLFCNPITIAMIKTELHLIFDNINEVELNEFIEYIKLNNIIIKESKIN